ncbi:glycoside hydrolase family 31 protein [Fodinibius saliphilus]|uniref:glycoside hydrolase family 31 protein n=1 Tax=Fodinibius saliphilus TaxID=1920650 RepID=UPI001108CA1F|nr:glycoside hydrolase family 31 protein [Fodinibius saliphilus]
MADNTSKTSNTTEEENDRQADVRKSRQPSEITSYAIEGKHVTFQSKNEIKLRITVHSSKIFQLKYICSGDQPTDFSYAIDPDWGTPETPFEVHETEDYYEISSGTIRCRIKKENMQATFLDKEGNTLCEDAEPYRRKESLMKGITEVRVTQYAPDGMQYFGLGDKVCEEGLRGEVFENWNTDAYGYERGDDPLYRSIPFYASLYDGSAFGIFLDSPYRSHFDFDSDGDNTCSFSAAGGCMNYYFIYGPTLTEVSQRYTRLTGTPELPPMWGLGYHQCRWSYYPEERVRELAETFREKQIPCDAIYLDIDYMDDYRIFTWNKDRFPNPRKLIDDLKEDGFETIVMIDPGVKVDDEYEVYRQGLEQDVFCKRPDGELMIGPVWPSETVFPDYTDPDVRAWWGDLYENLLNNKGVSGVWNDMNEPAVFEVESKTFPENIRHSYEGEKVSHKKAHNIYGMQMARASYEGIKKHNNGKRPFLLTRANFSGGQRYAALWTGDNIADWDHLKLANEQCQRLSISGYSFVGTDIGGFVKNPSPELFTRWLQLSIFHPLFRNHTMGYNVEGAAAVKEEEVKKKRLESDSHQEPWTFGDTYTDINRSVIELRYRLLHYLYTAFYRYVQQGTPILRPLAYYDQTDERAAEVINQFMFGDQIMVSPVLNKGKKEVETYFPKGQWYNFRTNEASDGRVTKTVEAPMDEIPFFIKAGTVLPLREVMQYTGQHDENQLELNLYYGNKATSSHLYEDAGEGYEHTKGNYQQSRFHWQPNVADAKASLSVDRSGSYKPAYTKILLRLIGLPFAPEEISVDGEPVSFEKEVSKQSVYRLTTTSGFKEVMIR